ncbi:MULTISPECIES: DUF2255 family protein [unclassified Rhodococcus (in: high G+C Gram-positive bacteria)]|uniref:DUF2255 family protein n=1 Tax=unclassified Rhodococcus (in: high G+C Gram-positive bacteria) TaxID=192944 RepID=UPI0016394E0A|nr:MULTISPECIES: DUF2255 family protein [unclassified Rhodococcus (in: high G+C Gram-positive bacteria)]MBC2640857.1 DUF2255 family protein [Rhodococcus sp. 3A]MBC2894399.1 DUF2255 family protein [Rhodococcus sp. 4CII]
MAWHSDQLDTIGHTEELHISSYRNDGSLRHWIPIWVVRVADDLYIRSAFGPDGGWYRNAMRNNTARISADGVETDVTLHLANDPATNAAVEAAYKAKYRSQPAALEPMIADTAAETTVRLDAAG